jgi:hypothetical protein
MVKKFLLSAVLSFATSLVVTSTALAADYTIIVSNQDVSLEQDTVVFSEQHIAPGFSKDYEIRVENRADVKARVILDKIEKVTPAVTNLAELMELRITYNGTDIALGKYYDKQFINRELLCVASESEDLLRLNLSFPKSAGNKYQADSFELIVSFKIDEEGCATLPPNTTEPDSNDLPKLPNTGQSQKVLTFLYWTVGLSLVLTIVLAFWVLLAFIRRRKEEQKETRKSKETKNRKTK